MSRRLERAEITLSGTAFDTIRTCAAGEKLEAVGLSVFCVATSGTVYFGIQPAVGGFVFLDQLNVVAGRYVNQQSYCGYPILEGDSYQVAFSGTGFVAASCVLGFIRVDPV